MAKRKKAKRATTAPSEEPRRSSIFSGMRRGFQTVAGTTKSKKFADKSTTEKFLDVALWIGVGLAALYVLGKRCA